MTSYDVRYSMHSMTFRWYPMVLAGILLAHSVSVLAQPPAREQAYQNPDSLVRTLYVAVTFGPGERPDWSYVRSIFHKDASVVLRVTKDSTAVMSVDGFVSDFVRFIDRVQADTSGFREQVVRVKPMILGNIAHLLVLYEASIPTSPRPPQQGVDSFHLVRSGGRWWITSMVNEVLTRDRPVPEILRD
jgi:hypothetical protein